MKKKERILLSSPHMSDEGYEFDYVKNAFETNWIAPLGANVDGFEQDIVDYSGSVSALALNSGTAALHLALKLCGISEGDHVACQSLTFSATTNPILYEKAIPVFIDSEPETWNMCPVLLERALSENPSIKAVMVVHLYGIPAKMTEILGICNKYNVFLIEDAAESLGSRYKGIMTGTIGHYGIYSFNGNKIITTSGGGMLISSNIDSVKFARKLSTQAREDELHYEHKYVGYNYRLSNVSAGIGRGQMKVLEDRVRKKREIYNHYKKSFSNISGIKMMPYPDAEGTTSNCWLTAITLEGKSPNKLINYLNDHNIEARPIWKPMHLQPVFVEYPSYGGEYSKRLFETGLCLPSDSKMTTEQQDYVSKLIIEFMGH